MPLLSIEGLRAGFAGRGGGTTTVVDGVSLSVSRGETLGIVGESGCGKSTLSLAIMGLMPDNGRIEAGRIMFDGTDLTKAPEPVMRRLRGNRIAMIFQEPLTSLNPLYTVGDQIAEAMRAHGKARSAQEVRERAIEALTAVRIPFPDKRMDEYPHQMSGGMRQRVMIAMALACEPDLLIADEPTTALDVTVQAQILDLLHDLQARTGMAMILITHNLGVVAEVADRVGVMYAGRLVEYGPVTDIFDDAQHPYTLGLLGSMPRLGDEREQLTTIEGSVPSPDSAWTPGCRFHPRCVFGAPSCMAGEVALARFGEQHFAACVRAPVEALHD